MTKKNERKMPVEPRTIESLAIAVDVPGTWESIAVKVDRLHAEVDKFQEHVHRLDEGGRSQLMWMVHAVHLIAYEWGWLEAREIVRKKEQAAYKDIAAMRERTTIAQKQLIGDAEEAARKILRDARNEARRVRARMKRVAKRETSRPKAKPKRTLPHLAGARRKK